MIFLLFSHFAKKFLVRKLSGKLRQKVFRESADEDDETGKDDERPDCAVHLIFAVILFCIAAIVLSYVIIFIHMPSQRFMNRNNEQCTIEKANLWCWRRKLLSFADVEEGRYTCWLFVVTHGNYSTETQYQDIDEFPIDLDGCDSVEECGEQTWACRVANNPRMVRLDWHYPMRNAICSVITFLVFTLFGMSALLSFFRERKLQTNEMTDRDNVGEGMAQMECGVNKQDIPFFSSTPRNNGEATDTDIRMTRPPKVYQL